MSFINDILNFGGKILGRTSKPVAVDKKMQIKPWDSIPDEDSSFDYSNYEPPQWKAVDYLKAAKGWVFACVTAIADEVASIDLRLYRKTKNEVEELSFHPLLDLLYMVNKFTTKFDHWWLTQEYLELTGEAPWLLDRGKSHTELPSAIYLLRPDKLSIKFGKETIIDEYVYEVSPRNRVPFTPGEIIFIKYPNPLKPFRGSGTIEAAAQTIDLDKYSEKWNVNFFYNAARPDAVLSTEQKLTQEQIDRMQKQWRDKFQGIDNKSKLAILESGLKYEQMQLSQKDMDFLEQQKYSRDKIFSIFRVPKSVIAISDDVNRATAETHAYSFARWTIKPKMRRIVDQLNEFLVPLYGDDLFLDFDDPVPENTEMKIAKYEKALGPSGWMTLNEVRDLENLEPVEGGDTIYRPIMDVPLGGTGSAGGGSETVEGGENESNKMTRVLTFSVKKTKKRLTDSEKLAIKCKSQLRSLSARNSDVSDIKEIDKAIIEIAKSFLVMKKNHIKNGKKTRSGGIKNTEVFWKGQISIEEKYEAIITSKMRDIFSEQEQTIIKKLDDLTKSIIAGGFGKMNYKQKYWIELKANISKVLLIIKIENEKIKKLMVPFFFSLIIDEGDYVLSIMDVGVGFTETVNVATYLKKYPIKFANSVNRNTNQAIRLTLAEGLGLGESVGKLTKRVESVFSDARGNRAQLIARTETARSANFATVEAYKQSGVVRGKKWLTAFDEVTCERCAALGKDDKIYGLDESFFDKNDEYMGVKLDYDDVDYPPLHVNCRCTIIPIVLTKGGPGSGHYGHGGRPGEVGGSAPGGGGDSGSGEGSWKPSMTESEATEWNKDSKYKETVFHGTGNENMAKISEEGFIAGDADLFGSGIYLTNNTVEAGRYGSLDVGAKNYLSVKVNASKIKHFPTQADYFEAERKFSGGEFSSREAFGKYLKSKYDAVQFTHASATLKIKSTWTVVYKKENVTVIKD